MEKLKKKGYSAFYQQDIAVDGSNWQTQWLGAAKRATLVVCILTVGYLGSKYCCQEFRVAMKYDKQLVVCRDDPSLLEAVDIDDKVDNGAVLMFLDSGSQALIMPSDEKLVEHICNRIEKEKNGSSTAPGAHRR